MQIGVDSQRAVENKRVFVIDSDDVSSMALQFMLADECETHVLRDVKHALDKGRDWPPQLVLLGSGTIALDGAAIVSNLKQQHPDLKILVVCNSAEEPAVKDALAHGANATLVRPLKLEAVRRKVDAQLGRRVSLAIPVVLG